MAPGAARTSTPQLDPSIPVAPLPLELVVHIFTLALPDNELSWTVIRLRALWLRRVCLLSRAWRAWGQRELLRHVVLHSDQAASTFVRDAAPLIRREGYGVETLRMGGVRNGGWITMGEGLGRVLEAVQGGEGEGLRELWLVMVHGADLRELRCLHNLRTLVCLGIQLECRPSHTQKPVPSTPPSLPLLETLILEHVALSPALRTIMFEDQQFPSLETLYFDSQEVLTQIFDGDPNAMPKLRALSPASDMQLAYLESLHASEPEDAETSRGGSLSSVGETAGGTQGADVLGDGDAEDAGQLWFLNVTLPVYRQFAYFAPSLPPGITHLRLDVPFHHRRNQVNELIHSEEWAGLFDTPDEARRPRRRGVQFLTQSMDTTTFDGGSPCPLLHEWFPEFLAERGVERDEGTPDEADLPSGVCLAGPQDNIIPWGFLRAARRAIAFGRARAAV